MKDVLQNGSQHTTTQAKQSPSAFAPEADFAPETTAEMETLETGAVDAQMRVVQARQFGHSLSDGGFTVQPALVMGRSGDRYEREADTLADQATQMQGIETVTQRHTTSLRVQREENSKPRITPEEYANGENSGTGFSNLETQIQQALLSGGFTLPEQTQALLTNRLGIQNPDVIRIHDDAIAHELCEDLHAQAFTTENHIFFASGNYNPDTPVGQELLFHEAVHTIQQGATQGGGAIASETQADAVLNGETAAAPVTLQQKAKEIGEFGLQLKEQPQSQQTDESLEKARALYEAMDGWGTDEDAIFGILENNTSLIPQIQQSYLKEYKRTLDYDLTDELSGDDLDRAMTALAKGSKVTNLSQKEGNLERSSEIIKAATELYNAMDGWGTDEETILNTLRGKSPEEIAALKAVYLDHYGVELEWAINDELSGADLEEANAYLSGNKAESAVAGLKNSLGSLSDWYDFDDDEEKIEEILMSLSDEEIKELKKHQDYPKIKETIEDDLSKTDLEVTRALLDQDPPNRAKVIALRLNEAMNGDYTDAGTDEAAVKKYLNQAHELKLFDQVKTEYQAIAKTSLEADIKDEFSGGELQVAESLLDTDPYRQAAARLYQAAYGSYDFLGSSTMGGWGTDEKAIFDEFKEKNAAEREKIIETYNQLYGKNGSIKQGLDFNDMLDDELSDGGMSDDRTKAQQYVENGELDPVFAIIDACQGVGTNEEQIQAVFKDKTRAEIAKIARDYENDKRVKQSPDLKDTLIELLRDELSGRDAFTVELLLKGKPETIAEKWELIRLRYEFEVEGWENSFSVAIMSLAQELGATTSKLQLQKQYFRLKQIVDENGKLREGYTEQDFEQVLNYTQADADSYQAAKNSVADAIVTGINITAAIVATVLSAGAASPWLVSAVVTGVGGAIGVAIKAGIEGKGYAVEDFGVDVVMVAVSAALAGATANGTSITAKLDEIAETFGETFARKVLGKAVAGAIESASTKAVESLIEEVLKNEKWRDGFSEYLADIAENIGSNTLLAAGTGFVGGAVGSTFEQVTKNKVDTDFDTNEARLSAYDSQARLENAQKNFDELDQKVNSLDAKANRTPQEDADLQSLKKQRDSAQNKLDKAKTRLDDIKEKVKGTLDQTEIDNLDVKARQQEFTSAKAELDTAKSDLDQFESKLKSADQSLKDAQTKVDELETKIDEMKNGLSTSPKQSTDDLETLKNELEKAKTDLEAQQKARNNANDAVENQKKVVDERQAELNTAKTKLEAAEQQKADWAAQSEQWRSGVRYAAGAEEVGKQAVEFTSDKLFGDDEEAENEEEKKDESEDVMLSVPAIATLLNRWRSLDWLVTAAQGIGDNVGTAIAEQMKVLNQTTAARTAGQEQASEGKALPQECPLNLLIEAIAEALKTRESASFTKDLLFVVLVFNKEIAKKIVEQIIEELDDEKFTQIANQTIASNESWFTVVGDWLKEYLSKGKDAFWNSYNEKQKEEEDLKKFYGSKIAGMKL